MVSLFYPQFLTSSECFIAIQILKFLGFKTVITYASAKHTDYLKAIGATHLIDRQIPLSDLSVAISKIIAAPIKTIYVAALRPLPDTQDFAYACLASGGQMIVAIPEPVKREDDPEKRRVIGINASAPYYGKFVDIMWNRLPKMLEDGHVVVCRSFCSLFFLNFSTLNDFCTPSPIALKFFRMDWPASLMDWRDFKTTRSVE